MPVIPMAPGLGQATPQVTGGVPDVSGIGAGLESIGRLAQTGADVATQLKKNDRVLKTTAAITQASQSIENYLLDQRNDVDFESQFERYQSFVDQIKNPFIEQFKDDPASLSVFETNFDQFAFKKSIGVRDRANKGIIDNQRAQLAFNLQAMSELSVQGGDQQQIDVDTAAELLIQDAVTSGAIGAEDAVKRVIDYKKGASNARVRLDIIKDPDAAVNSLLKGEYPGLSSESQIQWLERANNASEAQLRAKVTAADRAQRLADKAQREVEDETGKEGDSLLFNGELTSGWVEANRDDLSDEDYRYFLKSIRTGSEGATDINQYSDLLTRATGGEDVREEARAALRRGDLKLADYDKLVSRSTKNLIITPNWYKQGERFLSETFRVSDVNPDPANAQRRAIVLDEWNQWSDANPNATINDARQQWEQIASSYQIIPNSDMLILKPMPRFAIGNRSNLDIRATEARTVEAFNNGEINSDEFERQAVLLQEWSEALTELGGNNANQ